MTKTNELKVTVSRPGFIGELQNERHAKLGRVWVVSLYDEHRSQWARIPERSLIAGLRTLVWHYRRAGRRAVA